MEIAVLIIGILGLLPVCYWIYTSFIRKPHSIDFQVGNVSFVRIVSPNPTRNEKLALMIYSLAFVNTGTRPFTLKKIVLLYRFEGTRREAESISIPTGIVDGKKSVALTSPQERIIIAWENLHETLTKRGVLHQGEVIRGNVVFLLDAPVHRLREVSELTLMIKDYLRRKSTHKLTLDSKWYQEHEKGFFLVDAPLKENDGNISWDDITIKKKG